MIKQSLNKDWNYRVMGNNHYMTAKIILYISENIYDEMPRHIESNRFNKHPDTRRKLLIKKYISLWRHKLQRNKKRQAVWKLEFSASIDLLNLRIRDIALKINFNKSPKFLI